MPEKPISALRQALDHWWRDLSTTEVALLEDNQQSPKRVKVLAYSKIELTGDGIHLVNSDSPELIALHQKLILAALQKRMTVWQCLSKIL